MDRKVGEILIDDLFQEIEVPYNRDSDDNREEFLNKRDIVEVLNTQMKGVNGTDVKFRPSFN